jgi:soluble lytic murein transglycosylase-like protein
LALTCAATPAAAAPDWRSAGGSLFVAAPGESDPDLADPAAAVRLPSGVQPFGAAVEAAAQRHRLDPKLLHAIVAVESAYNPRALSPAGAAGLTQLMPGTARELGVSDRFDPDANLAGGADFLARQLLRFGDLRLAIAAYNAGPERVARAGRIPAIPETETYVAQVLDCYLALAAGRTVRRAADCRSPAP